MGWKTCRVQNPGYGEPAGQRQHLVAFDARQKVLAPIRGCRIDRVARHTDFSDAQQPDEHTDHKRLIHFDHPAPIPFALILSVYASAMQ
jgi:hypothetical protein